MAGSVSKHQFDATLTKPHFSCKVYRPYLAFLRNKFPEINLYTLCGEAGLSLDYLENENNFVSVVFDERFTRLCIEKTELDDFSFQVGAQSVSEEVLGRFLHFLATRTLSVSFIYQSIPRLTEVYSKVTRVEIIDQKENTIQLRFFALTHFLTPDEKESFRSNFKNIFQNTLGHYAAIPTTQNLPPAHIEYTSSEGPDEFPVYEMRLQFEASHPWSKLTYLVLPIALSFAIAAGFQWSAHIPFLTSIALCLATSLLWLISGRFYFFSIRRRFDQAIRAVQNADQRYTSLQQTQLELQKISESYKKFVPWEFIDLLDLKHITDLSLGQSVEKEMTVMFIDIRGFSAMSEQMTPKESFIFLNQFLENIAPPIREYGGFIDKYIGDGLMAIFPRSAKDAVQAAMTVFNRLSEFNLKQKTLDQPEIKIGIGINTGKVTLGTLGYKGQMQNTAISDVVNVASRLEQETKKFGAHILLSEKTLVASDLKEKIGARYLGMLTPKGKSKKIAAFEIYEVKDQIQRDICTATKADFEYAVKLFQAKECEAAKKIFEAVLLRNPQDKAAAYYLKTIKDSAVPHPGSASSIIKLPSHERR